MVQGLFGRRNDHKSDERSGSEKMGASSSTFVYAQLTDRIMPLDRGERYEDPLQEALELRGLGKVTGGSTQMAQTNEIEYVGVDIDLDDAAAVIPFVRKFLTERIGPSPQIASSSSHACHRTVVPQP
jgi:hypothetical protein